MNYYLFGKSGLRVSELALGTMTFGERWGWGASKAESKAMFEAYAQAGGNFLDTANLYTEGESEQFVGEFVAADRDHFVVASKYSLGSVDSDANAVGNSRKSLMSSLKASLERLQTDYLDILWLHAWDGLTPVSEVMRALDDVVRMGLVRYLAVSDTPAWVVSQANTYADLRGLTPFTGLQIEYSLIERTPERDLLPMAHAFNMAVTPWGALASGILTGKYNNAESAEGRIPAGHARLNEHNLHIAAEVSRVADELGITASQVALAWLRQQAGTMIPIVGARKLSQLEDNLASLKLELSAAHVQQLNDVSAIELGFPHSMLNAEPAQKRLLGTAFGKLQRS
ncbi:MAG: aldo/keto reductase [Deinococcota bacterium]